MLISQFAYHRHALKLLPLLEAIELSYTWQLPASIFRSSLVSPAKIKARSQVELQRAYHQVFILENTSSRDGILRSRYYYNNGIYKVAVGVYSSNSVWMNSLAPWGPVRVRVVVWDLPSVVRVKKSQQRRSVLMKVVSSSITSSVPGNLYIKPSGSSRFSNTSLRRLARMVAFLSRSWGVASLQERVSG